MEDFPRHVLSELKKVIGCTLAGYNEVNLSRNRIVVVFDPPQPEIDEAARQQFGALMHQHPVITYFDQTGDGQALKISDFLSVREYHRRPIYREFFRQLEAEDQISFGVQVGPGFMIGIAFNRGERSFTEKDRLRLNLLRPHIIQAYLHAAEISGYQERQIDLQMVLRESGVGIIALGSRGEVLHFTPGAFECLARYLPSPTTTPPSLPRRLVNWARSADATDKRDLLVIGHDLSRLIVRRARSGDRHLLLLSEESCDAGRRRLDQFALTPRETEVLRWLGEGKSNSEIATILNLTVGTVKLHVERVLAKLNVENRTAAALIVHGVVF